MGSFGAYDKDLSIISARTVIHNARYHEGLRRQALLVPLWLKLLYAIGIRKPYYKWWAYKGPLWPETGWFENKEKTPRERKALTLLRAIDAGILWDNKNWEKIEAQLAGQKEGGNA